MTALGEVSVEERPRPEVKEHEALVEVIASGICGTDIHGLSGSNGRREVGQVMGHEVVGVIVEVGDSKFSERVGDVVVLNPVVSCGACESCDLGEWQRCETNWIFGVRADVDGALSTDFAAPIQNLVTLPTGMPHWHGALVEPLAVGYHALQQGEPGKKDKVFVIGGGPIGQAVAIAARRAGLEHILVSEPIEQRRDLIGELGFNAVAPEDVPHELRRTFDGPPTLVIDAVGIDSTIKQAVELSTSGARIVLVGMGAPQLDLSAFDLIVKERHLVGAYCYSQPHFESTVTWLSENPEIADALVDLKLSLADGAAVFSDMAKGLKSFNKVVLMPRIDDGE